MDIYLDPQAQLLHDIESRQLTIEQLNALHAAKAHFGERWKGLLKDCWMYSKYPSELKQHQAELQQIRNAIGPTGLNQIKI